MHFTDWIRFYEAASAMQLKIGGDSEPRSLAGFISKQF